MIGYHVGFWSSRLVAVERSAVAQRSCTQYGSALELRNSIDYDSTTKKTDRRTNVCTQFHGTDFYKKKICPCPETFRSRADSGNSFTPCIIADASAARRAARQEDVKSAELLLASTTTWPHLQV